MIDFATIPAQATCDTCTASAETVERRGPRDELIQGNLPEGWELGSNGGHYCAFCVASVQRRACAWPI